MGAYHTPFMLYLPNAKTPGFHDALSRLKGSVVLQNEGSVKLKNLWTKLQTKYKKVKRTKKQANRWKIPP